MSNQIPVSFSEEFTSNVELLLQQEQSMFESAVMTGNYKGKAAQPVQQVGQVEAVKKTGRHTDTPVLNTPHDARWVFPVDYEWGDLIGKTDDYKTLASFEGPYASVAAAALNRAKDREIVDAAFSEVTKTGENGSTTTAWSTFVAANPGHLIAAGGTGMTVAKLRAARKALRQAHVPRGVELFVALSAEQEDDLLAETQVISLDYNSKPVLVDGEIASFMGFNFIQSEELEASGSNRRNIAWAKPGLHLGMFDSVQGRISERDDKSFDVQVYASGAFGATRTQEKMIVEILCAE